VTFQEHGLTFEADVVRGQKTGHFLDQRDNRGRVRELTRGARVLDVFSCTGGFSVHAAAGGATAVHSVDTSPFAIAAAKRNMERNASDRDVRACSHDDHDRRRVRGDGAARPRPSTVRRRRDRPPSFAQNAASVDRA
jgi:23S rRNA (cytosine1962-C5)-methyltransferase